MTSKCFLIDSSNMWDISGLGGTKCDISKMANKYFFYRYNIVIDIYVILISLKYVLMKLKTLIILFIWKILNLQNTIKLNIVQIPTLLKALVSYE